MQLKNSWLIMASSCAVFFALGAITASFGTALPDLARNASATLAQLGGLFTTFFLGALLSQTLSGPLIDRLGQRPVLLAGMMLNGCGVLLAASSHTLPITLAGATIAGFGFGAVGVAINLLVAATFATRQAAALNLVNVFYGLGAFGGPALASLTLRSFGSALPPLWIGAGMVIAVAIGLLFVKTTPAAPAAPADRLVSRQHIYRSAPLWTIGVLLLLSVGVESGMGAWTSTYVQQTSGLDAATGALATSAFWLAMTGGRMIAAAVGTRLSPQRLLFASLMSLAVGTAALLASAGNVVLTIAAIIIIGASTGPIYPTALSLITATFRHAAGTAAGVVVPMGSMGGSLLPWLQGLLLAHQGPGAGALLLVVGAVGMLGLNAVYRMLVRRMPPEASSMSSTTTSLRRNA